MSFKGRERSGKESDKDSEHSDRDDNFDRKVQSSRLYIGFLSDRVTKTDLEERFSKYGRVAGVSMQKGFAFLQYDYEDEAAEAIKQESGTMFKGSKIEVAHAYESKKRSGHIRGRKLSPNCDRSFRDRGRDFSHDSHKESRDRSLIRGDDRFRDSYKKDDRYQRRDYKDDARGLDASRDHLRRKYDDSYLRDRRDNFRLESSSFYRNLILDPKRPNDCEIIVLDKAYRLYAEMVERRLENLSLLVDMAFPKDEAFISQIIDDITRRGSLFAIVISQQHEAHGSVTLNILQGSPQEHRNMPLDDAVKLVAHYFYEYIQSRKEKMDRERSEAGPYGGFLPPDREMQHLLNQLSDGKFLTVAEIDRVMGYLRDRKEQLAGRVTETSNPTAPTVQNAEQTLATKQQELQEKILSIIGQTPTKITPSVDNVGIVNKSASVQNTTGQPVMGPNIDLQQKQSQQSTTYINFDNPNVKKALDNLIQTGPKLLESFGMSSSGNQDISNSDMTRGTISNQLSSVGSNTNNTLTGLGGMGNVGLQDDTRSKSIGFPNRMNIGAQATQGMGSNLGSQIRGSVAMNMERNINVGGNISLTPLMGSNLGHQIHGNVERNMGLSAGNQLQTPVIGSVQRNMITNVQGIRGSAMNMQSRMNISSNNFQNPTNLLRGSSNVRHPLLGTQIGNQPLHGRGRF